MKNSLNEIKINLYSNEYRHIDQGNYTPNNKINIKDFISNNFSTYSNNLYNINNYYNNDQLYPSSHLNVNNQIRYNNYRDLLNMSLRNKKIIVNKLGLSKKKDEKSNSNSRIIEQNMEDEKIFNNTINEKKINFSKNINKINQYKYLNKSKNNNLNNDNLINVNLDKYKNNDNPIFNDINYNILNNEKVISNHNSNISIQDKRKKRNIIKSSYLLNEYSIDKFTQKIFKNVFNKFIQYLNKYCFLICKKYFYSFLQFLKINKNNNKLSIQKINYHNLYNNYNNNKSRLIRRNLKSFAFDDSFKNNDISISVNKTNDMSTDKICLKKDLNIRTTTLDSRDFEKNKKYHKYKINNSLNQSNKININYDKINLFNGKIIKIKPIYKNVFKPINMKHNFYKRIKSLNKSKEKDNIIYSKKIIYNKPKPIINNIYKDKNLNLSHKYSTGYLLSGKMNNAKKIKKNSFNSFLKNKEIIDKNKFNINIIKNKLNKNNPNRLKISNSFYKKETRKINQLNNNKKGNKTKISLDYLNYLNNLCPKEIKKLFFSNLKNYYNKAKNYKNNVFNNYNKLYSLTTTTTTTCGTSEEKYSLERNYYSKNIKKYKNKESNKIKLIQKHLMK